MSCFLSAFGMVTSVGHTADTACAAIRAGISRPRELASFTVLDELGAGTPLFGHPVHGFSEGFRAIGRWTRLAAGALSDLMGRVRSDLTHDPSFWTRALIYAAIPEPDERFLSREPMDPDHLSELYTIPVLRHAGVPVHAEAVQLVRSRDVGFIDCLAQAVGQIAVGRAPHAIIFAVDSLLEPHCLSRLSATGRLKTADQPTGLAPGEAGVAVMLSARGNRARPGATCVLESAVVGKEDEFDAERNSSGGAALSAVIKAAVERSSAGLPLQGDWISTLNGEVGPASELGSTEQRLGAGVLAAESRLLHPFTEVGDTGTAAPAIACAMAAHGFRRGYARGDRTLISARADDGSVGAAVIGKIAPVGGAAHD